METPLENQRVNDAIAEVQTRIKAAYPEAYFQVRSGQDPAGIYIDAYTHTDDGFCVLDLVSDWLVDLSLEGLILHVVPLPAESVASR